MTIEIPQELLDRATRWADLKRWKRRRHIKAAARKEARELLHRVLAWVDVVGDPYSEFVTLPVGR